MKSIINFLNRNGQINTTVLREHLEMAAEAVIDSHRYGNPNSLANRMEMVLARFEDVTPVLPTADEMTAKGGDIVVIAHAITRGISVRALGEAIDAGLDLRAFCNAVKNGLRVRQFAGLVRRNDIGTVNEGLEQFADYMDDRKQHPSVLDRVAAMWGEGELVAA